MDILGVGQGVEGGHLARHHDDEQAAHLFKKTVQGRVVALPVAGKRGREPAITGLSHGHGPRSTVVHGLPSQVGEPAVAWVAIHKHRITHDSWAKGAQYGQVHGDVATLFVPGQQSAVHHAGADQPLMPAPARLEPSLGAYQPSRMPVHIGPLFAGEVGYSPSAVQGAAPVLLGMALAQPLARGQLRAAIDRADRPLARGVCGQPAGLTLALIAGGTQSPACNWPLLAQSANHHRSRAPFCLVSGAAATPATVLKRA